MRGRSAGVPRSHKATRSFMLQQGRAPWHQNQAATKATSEIHSSNVLSRHLLCIPAGPCSFLCLEQNKTKPFGCDFSKVLNRLVIMSCLSLSQSAAFENSPSCP